MKYIYKSLEFSQQNLGLLSLLILANITPIVLSSFQQTEDNVNILYSLLLMLVYVFSFFFISGTYSLIWKKYKNESIDFSLLISESKKYFCNFIGVSIVIAIFGLIITIIFSLIYKYSVYKNFDSADFYSTSEFATIISISFYLILAIYCYAVPYLYVKKLNSKKAIRIAPKIFIKYKHESIPVIILLLMNMLITFFYPEDTIVSWQRTTLTSVINAYIYFHIFLVSSQILDEIDISEFENASAQNREII